MPLIFQAVACSVLLALLSVCIVPSEGSGNVLYGYVSNQAPGEPQYFSSIGITINLYSNRVVLDLTGPADWLFGFGFDNTQMFNTYAIVISETGSVTERILGDHNPGTDITGENEITIESDTVYYDTNTNLHYRNIILSRDIDGHSAYDFPTESTQLNIIWSQFASAPVFRYHGRDYRGISSVDIAVQPEIQLYGELSVTAPGDPQYVSTIKCLVDTSSDTVRLDLTGPADWFFAFGFDAFVMENTYAFIVTEVGNLVEHILGDHNKGTQIHTPGLSILSSKQYTQSSTNLVFRNIVFERSISGLDNDGAFTFPIIVPNAGDDSDDSNVSINMIWSQGGGPAGTGRQFEIEERPYHGRNYRGFGVELVLEIIPYVCPNECDNMPCDCEETENCKVCNLNQGCVQCKNGYFKKDGNSQCVHCKDTFGEECKHCADGIGCLQCDNGYNRVEDSDCGLWYCEQS